MAATLAMKALKSRTWRLSVLIQTKNHPEIQHLSGGSQLAVVSCKGTFLTQGKARPSKFLPFFKRPINYLPKILIAQYPENCTDK